MTKTQIRDSALALAPQERLEVVEALWESLEDEDLPLPKWQQELLDRRLADLDAGREPTRPWEEVRARLWSRSE